MLINSQYKNAKSNYGGLHVFTKLNQFNDSQTDEAIAFLKADQEMQRVLRLITHDPTDETILTFPNGTKVLASNLLN